MKRSLLILFTIVASICSNVANAQCYDENTHLLNLGVGFGNSYYKYNRSTGYDYGRTPVFILSYEQPLRNKVGPGYIGVGAIVSFQHAYQRYNYPNYVYNGVIVNDAYYQHNWNYYVVAARGAYHLDFVNADKAELYAGTIIGVRINSYNYTYHNIDNNKDRYELNEGAVYPALSVYAGARWYFVPNVALYGEIGTGLSFLSGGLTFKF
ncbi:MAG TPA: hypothetical protein VFF27_00390 [Bacteroidia bacterium]|nr:hypothetical protein [Bacteroidia bacterium]